MPLWRSRIDDSKPAAEFPLQESKSATSNANLDSFITDFFRPIVADDVIDSAEETPLCIAFLALGINHIDERVVATRLREEVARLGSYAADPSSRARPAEALRRLRSTAFPLSPSDLTLLSQWFGERRKVPASEVAELTADWPVARSGALDRRCLEQFSALLHPLRREGAVADATASAVAAPTHHVVDVESRITDAAAIERAASRLWHDAFDIVGELRARMRKQDGLELAFDRYRREPRNRTLFLPPPATADRDVWFVGDVHGDFLGLEAAIDVIDQNRNSDSKPLIVFLGDLIDRGPLPTEVLLRIYDLAVREPASICLLAGNHDEGLVSGEGGFHSSVSPSDFADLLNSKFENELWRMLGTTFVDVTSRLPRALFFADGLMAAHGGIPHVDLQQQITSPSDLDKPECLQDFVWTRAHRRAPRKLPNRNSRGCEFGVLDFSDFARVMADRCGQPITGMVRGHTHEEDRFAFYDSYTPRPILTINNMSFRMPDEVLGSYPRTPCIARWRENQSPELYRIRIGPSVLNAVAPEPSER